MYNQKLHGLQKNQISDSNIAFTSSSLKQVILLWPLIVRRWHCLLGAQKWGKAYLGLTLSFTLFRDCLVPQKRKFYKSQSVWLSSVIMLQHLFSCINWFWNSLTKRFVLWIANFQVEIEMHLEKWLYNHFYFNHYLYFCKVYLEKFDNVFSCCSNTSVMYDLY